ncbi:N-acetyltransferase [Streptomyces sp. MK37H]|uniref:GNAT family N-acetyltransferase n=1 Tax=Streptomyces sp. MK37H TaxID=2699117 RepID=UPI001B382794|nr:GNAT family N-acetyltransferase [Streptomyces sp. MK37H]MBP8535526.1 GNAT family N-acetyltransferase [Streptomyces sp. MK37H]
MAHEDLPFVVDEHRAHFPDGFFARLGPRFLTAYTATYLGTPHARGYIAEVGGLPAGFLVGVIDPAAHRGQLVRKHGTRLALRACAALSLRPLLTLHFIRTRLSRYCRKLLPARYTRGQEELRPVRRDGATAVLSHVAVNGSARSLGLGSALIERFTQDAAAAGCARVNLVTAAGPDGAGRYYERLGWRFAGSTRTPEGRSFLTYEYPLYTPFPDDPRLRYFQGPAQ